MKILAKALVATAAVVAFSSPASALTYLGQFSGTECSGVGGFPNCWATQTGVQQGPVLDPLGSPAIYKVNSDGSTDFSGLFPTIDGSEFVVNFNGGTDTLSFTYNKGAGDPIVHYFSIKQSDSYILFYDALGITSGSVNLSTYFPNNPGYSHITWFDTGDPRVPEPATWAMMLVGFGAAGMAMRRSRRKAIAQLA